ncbi:hypothetical protein ACJJTC_007631 [Scirpophaga incertulas]
MKITVFFTCYFLAVSAYELSDIVSGRIESCRGCSLNRLPEVKKFILDDAPLYHRVDVKFISGALPEFILLGVGDFELERIPLSELTQQECNELLQNKGFIKKGDKSEF